MHVGASPVAQKCDSNVLDFGPPSSRNGSVLSCGQRGVAAQASFSAAWSSLVCVCVCLCPGVVEATPPLWRTEAMMFVFSPFLFCHSALFLFGPFVFREDVAMACMSGAKAHEIAVASKTRDIQNVVYRHAKHRLLIKKKPYAC